MLRLRVLDEGTRLAISGRQWEGGSFTRNELLALLPHASLPWLWAGSQLTGRLSAHNARVLSFWEMGRQRMSGWGVRELAARRLLQINPR